MGQRLRGPHGKECEQPEGPDNSLHHTNQENRHLSPAHQGNEGATSMWAWERTQSYGWEHTRWQWHLNFSLVRPKAEKPVMCAELWDSQ